MTLQLAPGLKLPDDTVTQALGILAKRGAGKSNAGAVLAEEMHRVGLQFVAVDPVGAWWGLRSSADGNGAGLPIPVLGGYHGDVPLEPGAGHLIADLVVGERLSAVVDVSAFSEGEKKRFLADFAERLFREKGKPGHEEPLHLFLEEADDYAPQGGTRAGDVGRCLGAFQRIVKQGRARGLGSTMITQRSAALNKDLLTQIDTLIVLRTTSPQDRKAIEGWVTFHDADKDLLESLSGLVDGEAWVWSPEALDITKRIRIRRRATFDSGATPKAGAKRRAPKTVADVDLAALEARMKDTIERAKESDPKLLQRRVRELEKELRDSRSAKPKPRADRVEVPVLAPEVAEALRALSNGVVERIERVGVELRHSGDELVTVASEIRDVAAGVLEIGLPVRPIERDRPSPAPRRPVPISSPQVREQKRNREIDTSASATLGKGEQKVLAVLRQWPEGRTYNELAFLAGYSAKASTLGVILSKLRQLDYVEPGNQPVRLTAEGLDAAGGYEALPSGAALLDHWRNHPRMGSGERTVLQVLVEQYPDDLSHEELCELAGYSLIASTMGVILSKLRKLGLVEKKARRLASEFAESIGL